MPVPFNKPSLVGKELDYIQKAVECGQLSGDGYYTGKCNKRIEELTGAPKALITHSCTAALEMAARLCDLGPGDEVIMPSFTFVSTANAVVLTGATPVFVDISEQTLNLDVDLVARAVTPKTRAIIAVHYAGVPADMDALATLAQDRGLYLIEDAAQALGSTYKGRLAGSLGDLAAFSFHETKNIISGEGGALTLNRPEMFERAEIIREKGTNRTKFRKGEVNRYSWVDIGSSYLPGELVAAYLFAQLQQSEAINKTRLELYDTYRTHLTPYSDRGLMRLPQIPNYAQSNGHIFYMIMNTPEQRGAFIDHMKASEIVTPYHYIPLHSSKAGKRYARVGSPMDRTDAIAERLVRLPLYKGLRDKVHQVIDRVKAYFGEA